MKLHRNAALSWSGRRVLAARVVEQGWTLTAAAEAAGVSVRCARKWVGRYRFEGEAGLRRSLLGATRVANRTPADRVAVIVALRQLRMTAAEIAETLAMPLSTVSAVLSRAGIGPSRPDRARAGSPLRTLTTGRARPHRRQEARPHRRRRRQTGRRSACRQRTGRAAATAPAAAAALTGWEYVHVAVDDYSRLAYAEVLPDEKADQRDRASSIGHGAFFARHGIPRRSAS